MGGVRVARAGITRTSIRARRHAEGSEEGALGAFTDRYTIGLLARTESIDRLRQLNHQTDADDVHLGLHKKPAAAS